MSVPAPVLGGANLIVGLVELAFVLLVVLALDLALVLLAAWFVQS